MAIDFIKYQGFNSIKLSFNNYSVIIMYERGCNIIELNDTVNHLSLLHYPESGEEDEFVASPQRFGSALLFPPNKLRNGSFLWNGIPYSFTEHGIPFSHGLLKEFPFTLKESSETADCIYVKFEFNSFNSVYFKEFQWLFDCVFEFELSSMGLLQKLSFSNNGSTDIPLGVGFHTAFRIPQDDTSAKEDYHIQVSCGRQWELDEHSFPTGKLIPLSQDYPKGNVTPLTAPIAEHTQSVALENGFHGAIITNKRTGIQFIYETDPVFSNWMIWNNRASDNYICIEPMSCIINAPNTDLLDSSQNFVNLKPGHSWEAKNRLYIKC